MNDRIDLKLMALLPAPAGYNALTVLVNRDGTESDISMIVRTPVLAFEIYVGNMTRPRTANPVADQQHCYVIEQPDGRVILHVLGVEGTAVVFDGVSEWFDHWLISRRQQIAAVPTAGNA